MAHLNGVEILKSVNDAKQVVPEGSVWHHYKSSEKTYNILAIGVLEDTEEVAVVYKANYGDGITWVRRLSVFTEEVEFEGKMVPRFQRVPVTQ